MRRLLIAIQNIISIPVRLLFTHISVFAVLQDSKVDKNAAICKGVRFYRSEIGKYSYISNDSFVNNTHIGSFTSIGGNCYIGGTSHPVDWVSTSPVFHGWSNIMKKNFCNFDYEIFQETNIGNDVWIGEGCKIKSGINIGDGSVIGMGSVVTKNVPAYEIWAGNPAKKIRDRVDDETKEVLLNSEWWKLPDEDIQKVAHLFNDVNEYKAHTKSK